MNINIPRKFNVAMDEEQETSNIARAILDTSHHVLTGMEIAMLEAIAGMIDDDWNSFSLTVDQIRWFYSLQTQFAREIAKWKGLL
jgi:hypothetical protein